MFVKYLKHAVFFIIILLFALNYSCEDLAGGAITSAINSRITAFEDDLNATDRSGLPGHFHPDTENYSQIQDETIFDSGPLSAANKPFDIVVNTPTDQGNDTWIATGTMTHNSTTFDISLTFKENAGSWLILVLDLDSGSYEIRRID